MQHIYKLSTPGRAILPMLLATILLISSQDTAKAQQHHSSRLKVSKLSEQKHRLSNSTASGSVEATATLRVSAATISLPRTVMTYSPAGTTWELSGSTTYTYDNMGRVIESLWKNSDGTTIATTTYTYNSMGQVTEESTRNIDEAYSNRYTYAYDTRGNETEEVRYRWINLGWEYSDGYRSTYTYDSNGRISEEIKYTKSNNDLDWKLDYKEVYTYNTSGALLTETDYLYENSAWSLLESTIYTYAAPNTAPTTITYMITNEAGVLLNDERIIDIVWRDYNPATGFGDEASYIYQEWVNGSWANEYKYETTYGQNGSSVSIESYWENDSWNIGMRFTETYDAHGNKILDQAEDWKNGVWEIYYAGKSSYTYNSANQVEEVISQTWDEETKAFVVSSRSVYSDYQTITSAPKEAAALLTEVYPNPTSDRITVRIAQTASPAFVRITDITGKAVYTKQLAPATTQYELDLSALPSGLYMLQLSSGKAVAMRKIIKQ